jgi:NAD(P) transhydrogenase subunit alpha
LLVTEAMVEAMQPGSVVVDGAASTGGNCELTVADQVVTAHGVTIIGPTDLASRLATHASQMLARNVYELLSHLADDEGNLTIDMSDEITAGVVVATGGAVTNERVRELTEKA